MSLTDRIVCRVEFCKLNKEGKCTADCILIDGCGECMTYDTNEASKWFTICQKCEYKDSAFMPCNACDDSGSEFKEANR